jgi:hypothetical protein
VSSVKLPDWIDNDEVIRRFTPDGKVQKLPPWTGNDHAMLQWLTERLGAMAEVALAEELGFDQKNDPYPLVHQLVRRPKPTAKERHADAIERAERGDIEPLRKLCPEIAEYIHLPKRGRGKRYSLVDPIAILNSEHNPIRMAALDAKRIGALWERFYSKRRRGRYEKSAEWFAAQLWTGIEDQDDKPVEITEGKVINRLKKKLSPSK